MGDKAQSSLLCRVGARVIGQEHLVDPDSVRKFVLATNDDVDLYVSDAPPTYIAVASWSAHMELLRRALSFEMLAAAVHLSQSMRFERLLRIGEKVSSQSTLVEVRGTRIGCTFCIHTELMDDRGVAVADGFHRVLLRNWTGCETEGESPDFRTPGRRGNASALGTVSFDIPGDLSVRYSSASGDHLPIHKDREVARAAGFPDLILHGMCTVAMCGGAVVDLACGGDPTRLAALSATFTRPVIVSRSLDVVVQESGNGCIGFVGRQSGREVTRNGMALVREARR
jgi:acyl dehydratase